MGWVTVTVGDHLQIIHQMYKWSKFNQNLHSFQKPKLHYVHTEFETIRADQNVQYSFNDGNFNNYHEQNEVRKLIS